MFGFEVWELVYILNFLFVNYLVIDKIYFLINKFFRFRYFKLVFLFKFDEGIECEKNILL